MTSRTELPRVRCLPANPAALSEAREFVRELAEERRLSEQMGEELALAVTEACSNAVRHTDSLLVLVSWREGDLVVEVQVKDDGIFERKLPITGPAGREGGLGMALMMMMVDEFAIRQGTYESPGTLVRLRKNVVRTEEPVLMVLPDPAASSDESPERRSA